MIVYAVICRSSDAAILCEHSEDELTGNAPQCTAAILEHLRDNPNILKEGDLKTFRNTNNTGYGSGCGGEDDFFSQFMQACTVAISTAEEMDLGSIEEYYFHLWHQGGIFYCCLGDDKDQRQQKVNFGFLQSLAKDFGARYSTRRIKNANSYSLDKDFKPVMRSTMHHYNVHRKDIMRQEHRNIDQMMAQVEDLKNVLGRNLNLLLEKDQHIDSLMDKAVQARQDSMIFKKKSIRAKRSFAMKSYKMWFIICFSLAIFLYFIIMSACGFRFKYCTSQE
jgi:hypothetical protein